MTTAGPLQESMTAEAVAVGFRRRCWNDRQVEIRHTHALRRIYQADRSWRATASRRVRSTSPIAAGCEARFTTQGEIRRGPSPSATSLSTASAMRCRF